jgi:hypothetical protein
MFPPGLAGVALVLLRFSVAAMLFTNVLPTQDPTVHMWEVGGVCLLAASLGIGIFTPVVSVLACCVEIAAVSDLKELGVIHLASSILITASVAMLGPGAYSVDARMFGRRLVVSSSDDPLNDD